MTPEKKESDRVFVVLTTTCLSVITVVLLGIGGWTLNKIDKLNDKVDAHIQQAGHAVSLELLKQLSENVKELKDNQMLLIRLAKENK